MPDEAKVETPPVVPAPAAPAPAAPAVPAPDAALVAENERLRKEADELRVKAAEADMLRAEKDTREKKELEEKGQFKELAGKLEHQLGENRSQFQKRLARAEVRAHVIAAGAIDLAVADLISIDGIKISDDGEVDQATVKAAVEKFKGEKPNFFGSGRAPVQPSGGPPAPKPDEKPGVVNLRDPNLSQAEVDKKLAELTRAAQTQV